MASEMITGALGIYGLSFILSKDFEGYNTSHI